MKLETWEVLYWSLKVQNISIVKHGTEGDEEKLPEVTKRNRPRPHRTRETEYGRLVKRRNTRWIIQVLGPNAGATATVGVATVGATATVGA